MATTSRKPKLLVIVGPTASGKSNLALKIAKEFKGEIIAADSRTTYKGMDIGTAKPTSEQQKQVTHWGLDLVEPGEQFNAYQFKQYAQNAIKNIQKRGKLPILVGGSGLYIDSILFDLEFVPVSETQTREELEKLSVEELQKMIEDNGYKMPENYNNRRHLIRTIERKGQQGAKSQKPKANSLIIGLMPPNEVLKERISVRAEAYFKNGLVKEVSKLLKAYGEKNILKSSGIAYLACTKLIKGEITEELAKSLIRKEEWQYARRQKTWFRRNKFIQWHSSSDDAYHEISAILNN